MANNLSTMITTEVTVDFFMNVYEYLCSTFPYIHFQNISCPLSEKASMFNFIWMMFNKSFDL